jgi:hypothetical protein
MKITQYISAEKANAAADGSAIRERLLCRREDRTVTTVIRRALEAYEAAHREEQLSA